MIRPVLATLLALFAAGATAADPWLTLSGEHGPGSDGSGKGKKIVLISGDEEYRSEEALPMLGRILAERHGFDCTVLFAIDPETGQVDPNYNKNIPGLEKLRDADLMIIATRWRDLPADQMKEIDAYLKSGRPVIGLRTATHALKPADPEWAYYADGYKGDKKEWEGGFGRVVLGEMWISHHGKHKEESTRGLIAPGAEGHPILRGIESGDIWGNTDVYGVRLPLPGDSKPLVLGQVLTGMKPTDPPVEGAKNAPMMPVAWEKSYQIPGGEKGKAFTTTMGSATDLANEGVRRLIVNAAYHLLGADVPKDGADVPILGDYKPSMYGFGGSRTGLKPQDFTGK